MKRRYVALGLAVAVVALAAGCYARINSVIINRNTQTRAWDVDNILLAHDIRVLDVKEEVKDDMLYVNVLIKNGWGAPLGGKLKVLFFDQNGVQLDDPWGWRQLMLESYQEQWFKFIAPAKEDDISRLKIMVRGINKYSSSG
jgi:hypothetical protein